MSSVNKVLILGRLGKDPELQSTQGGQSVCKMSVATSERFKKGDDWQERTEWHKIVVWGRTGEAAAEHLRKGQQVYLEGRIQTRSWDDKDGQKRYMTEIVADRVVFLGGGQGDRGEQEERGSSRSSGGGRSQPRQERGSYGGDPGEYAADDDQIPF